MTAAYSAAIKKKAARKDNKGMNCKELKDSFDTFPDGELNEKKSSDIEQHLKFCHQCRTELKSMDKCIRLMSNFMKDVTPPDTIRKKIFEKLKCSDM